jgi:hypothetical protein
MTALDTKAQSCATQQIFSQQQTACMTAVTCNVAEEFLPPSDMVAIISHGQGSTCMCVVI